MNKSTFNKNFDQAILNILIADQIDFKLLRFKLVFIDEKKGVESSRDNWMETIQRNLDIENNVFEYDDTIRLMNAGDSRYPLWAIMKQIDDENIEIKCSSRFRHIKTCHNQEGGIPPFENKI